jgi:hypothetical protein
MHFKTAFIFKQTGNEVQANYSGKRLNYRLGSMPNSLIMPLRLDWLLDPHSLYTRTLSSAAEAAR